MTIYDVLKVNYILVHNVKYPERNMFKRLKENYLWTHINIKQNLFISWHKHLTFDIIYVCFLKLTSLLVNNT